MADMRPADGFDPPAPHLRTMAAELRDYVLSFYRVRQALGALGLAMPIGLVIGTLVRGDPLPPSLSDFYYTPMRDIFVGILVALGVFLITYRGHRDPHGPISDRVVSQAAGLGAIGIALFPNDTLEPCAPKPIWDIDPIGMLHVASAGIFLTTTAIFCLFLFQRSSHLPPRPQKQRRNKIYASCGWAIIAALVLLGIYFLGLSNAQRCALVPYKPVLWLEVVTVLAFGLAWLVKGRGIKFLNDVRGTTLQVRSQ